MTIAPPEKVKFPRALAIGVAREMVDALRLVAARILVAGSLRRGKALIGDVEILFIPRLEYRADPGDMFGKTVLVDLAAEKINELVRQDVLAKRTKKDQTCTWGDENKLAVHLKTGIPVDLFSARTGNWACLSVCRTGSKETNQRICEAAIARGWKWQPYGAGFEDRHTGAQVRTVRSEREVFEAVGLKYLEPWER